MLICNGINIDGQLLEVKTDEGSIYSYLSVDQEKIYKNYKIWRYFSAIFVHLSLLHILMNSLTTVIFGSLIESIIGFEIFAIIYLGSGIGGTYMSSAMMDRFSSSVGASGAIMGIIVSLIGILVVNWKVLEKAKALRCMMVCMVMMVVILMLLFSLGTSGGSKKAHVDNWAHLGGAITGLC